MGQQQGQQACGLAPGGQQLVQHPGQVEGPVRHVITDQIRAGDGGVAGGVEQVHHGEGSIQAAGQLGRGWHGVGDVRGGDLLLGAGDPGGHGRLADQERPGYVRGGYAADQPQRQSHLRLGGQRRVTAGEHQPEPVIGKPYRRRELGVFRHDQQGQLALERTVTAEVIQRDAPGHSGQPGTWARRDAVASPGGQRLDVGILDRFLGGVDVAGHAHRRGEHVGPLATVRSLDRLS